MSMLPASTDLIDKLVRSNQERERDAFESAN